mgnify:CR=1 FL=1
MAFSADMSCVIGNNTVAGLPIGYLAADLHYSTGKFMPDNANAQADENDFEEQLKRKDKKKKQRKIKF